MLILSRRTNETFWIDSEIEVKVLSIRGNRARIGIDAPPNIYVHRNEIKKDKDQMIISSRTGKAKITKSDVDAIKRFERLVSIIGQHFEGDVQASAASVSEKCNTLLQMIEQEQESQKK